MSDWRERVSTKNYCHVGSGDLEILRPPPTGASFVPSVRCPKCGTRFSATDPETLESVVIPHTIETYRESGRIP